MSVTRRVVLSACLAAGATTRPGAALAQDYPTRPVRIVVPYVPGGVTDNMARLLATKLGPRLGQPVVVENRPGAGGIIGTDHVIRAAPDGHTLLFATVTLTVYPSFSRQFTANIHRDLSPVTIVSSAPYVLIVNQSSPFRTLGDLIARARAEPGRLNFGSPGVGTSTHLAFEAFLSAAGVRMTHVPYGGSAAALTALMANDVQAMLDTYIGVAGPIESGTARALAVTSRERAGFNPSIPTATEAGLPGFTADTWFGVLAPARTPGDVVTRLHAELAEVLKEPQVAESFGRQGSVVGNTPAAFAETMVADERRWARVIADAGITPQ